MIFKTPRPYQQDIINQTLNSKKNTLIQLPTGGGKTIIAKHIIFELIHKSKQQIKILFIVPKRNLLEQTKEEFKSLRPEIIHGSKKHDENYHLFLSTLQTASRRELQPDIIIVDEIHFGYEGIMLERLIKDNTNARIIGLSATPYDKDGNLLHGFDLVIDKYDINYLVDNNYLIKPKCYALTRPTLKNIKIVHGDYDLKQLGSIMCNKNTILEIVKTTKEYIEQSKKTIVFAVNIEHAELLTKAYESDGLKARVIHSKLSKSEIDKEIESFKLGYNNIKILVSVLMITTGFDVPDVECAVIARPTRSQILYKQMVGRILRPAQGKSQALLLDCGSVIENLGMPLDPIQNDSKDSDYVVTSMQCDNCGSENIHLKIENEKRYWICNDCEYKKEIEKNLYRCNNCGKSHDDSSNFTIDKDSLYLRCECGYDTLISEYLGEEQFVEILDDEMEQIDSIRNIVDLYRILQESAKATNKEMNEMTEDIKKNLNKYTENKVSYFNLDLQEQSHYKLHFEVLYNSIVKNDYDTFIFILEKTNLIEQSVEEFMDFFSSWYGFKDNLIEEHLTSIIKTTNDYRILDKLIELNLFDIFSINRVVYENNLCDIANHILEKNSIRGFEISTSLIIYEEKDLYENFKEEFFKKIAYNLDMIELKFGLGGDYIFEIDEIDGTEEYLDKLDEMTYFLMYTNHFFKKLDVKVLICGKIFDMNYFDYQKSVKYLQENDIHDFQSWLKFLITVSDYGQVPKIPKYPNIVYKDEWKSWLTWFSLDSLKNDEETRKDIFMMLKTFLIDTKQSSVVNYDLMIDEFLSKLFDKLYDTEKARKILSKDKDNEYLSFKEAREFIRKLNLKSKKDWNRFKLTDDMPANIPKEPHIVYNGKGWKNTEDWIGKEKTKSTFLTKKDSLKENNFEGLTKYFDFYYNKNIEELNKKPDNNIKHVLKLSIDNAYEKIQDKIQDKNYTEEEAVEIRNSIVTTKEYFDKKIKFM